MLILLLKSVFAGLSFGQLCKRTKQLMGRGFDDER